MKICKVKKSIYCTLTHPFIHAYSGASEPEAYLRNAHRHLLHIKVSVSVSDNNREIEFISMKNELAQFLCDTYKLNICYAASMEDIAEALIGHVLSKYGENREVTAEVSEDGENGAIVTSTPYIG